MLKKRLLVLTIGILIFSFLITFHITKRRKYIRKIDLYTTAVSNNCDYYFNNNEVRCDILNIMGQDCFIISQGYGFDIYRLSADDAQKAVYMATFSDNNTFYYNAKNRLILSIYNNGKGNEIYCITKIDYDWNMSLVEAFGIIDNKYYKNLQSSYTEYFGQKILAQSDVGDLEDTCKYFYGGNTIPKKEFEKLLKKYKFKKLQYTKMQKYNGLVYHQFEIPLDNGRVIVD